MKAVCWCKYNVHIAHGLNATHVHITGCIERAAAPKSLLRVIQGTKEGARKKFKIWPQLKIQAQLKTERN